MGLLGSMSAIGTALGPSLGGALIAGFGWRSIFLINVPVGILTWVLSRRYLPEDRPELKTLRTDLDILGSLWLASSLGAYELAMTLGCGSFGMMNGALKLLAGTGLGLFLRTEAKAASPLIQLKLFRDPVLSASLAMSSLVATVIMATLIVGPFYLSRSLGLETTLVGLVMKAGPLVAALTAMPSGRAVDRFGSQRMTIVGLIAMTAGSLALAILPTTFGIAGYSNPTCHHHRRMCTISDGQQHYRHADGAVRPARCHLRHERHLRCRGDADRDRSWPGDGRAGSLSKLKNSGYVTSRA